MKSRKPITKGSRSESGEEHLKRVRRICAAMPESTEKLSHGEPTFFVRKKVFAMFANNHHNDGHKRRAHWSVDTCPTGSSTAADQEFAGDIFQTALRRGAWLGRHRA